MPDSQQTGSKEAEFHPFKLLGIILSVTAVIAVISYGLQLHYLGPG